MYNVDIMDIIRCSRCGNDTFRVTKDLVLICTKCGETIRVLPKPIPKPETPPEAPKPLTPDDVKPIWFKK